MPSGALEFVVMIAITYVCLRLTNTRTWCMTVALTIALVGSIMVFAAPYHDKAALLCGYYFVSKGKAYSEAKVNLTLVITGLRIPHWLHYLIGNGVSQRCRPHKESGNKFSAANWLQRGQVSISR